MQMNKDKIWKITSVALLVSVGALFMWQAQQVNHLQQIRDDVNTTKAQVEKIKHKTKYLYEKQLIEYKHDYFTMSADKALNTFFKESRTYSDSKSYNTRKNRIVRAGVATENIINSDMFLTDREETGEAYIDNTGMSVSFENQRFFVTEDKNGELKGTVIVESTINNGQYADQPSIMLYDVIYDKEKGMLTNVKYLYGLLTHDN